MKKTAKAPRTFGRRQDKAAVSTDSVLSDKASAVLEWLSPGVIA